jgi:hypothetical protein
VTDTEVTTNIFAGGTGVPDPGGYTIAALMDDGEALCESCLIDPTNPVHILGDDDGWRWVAWMTSGEAEEPDHCAHCSKEWTGLDPIDDDQET